MKEYPSAQILRFRDNPLLKFFTGTSHEADRTVDGSLFDFIVDAKPLNPNLYHCSQIRASEAINGLERGRAVIGPPGSGKTFVLAVGPNICIGRYGAISTSSAIYSGLRPLFSVDIIRLPLRTSLPSNIFQLCLSTIMFET